VSMDFREASLLMTVETAAFENEASSRIEPVALRALYARNGRMVMKLLEIGGRIRAHKESHFFPAALPCQNHHMRPRR